MNIIAQVTPEVQDLKTSLTKDITDNPNNFQTGLEIHGLHTRSKNQLFIPIANLASVQKGMTYSGIKIYNSLLSNIVKLKNDRKQFKNELYRYTGIF
jgi:hypothetical protein